MTAPLYEIEGTWEEITAQIPDFANQKLHVIVLPVNETAEAVSVTPSSAKRPSEQELLAAYEGIAADKAGEEEALEWIEAMIGDVSHEAR